MVPPRIRRADRDATLADLRPRQPSKRPILNGSTRHVCPIEARAYCLSLEQIDEANAPRDGHWKRRITVGCDRMDSDGTLASTRQSREPQGLDAHIILPARTPFLVRILQ